MVIRDAVLADAAGIADVHVASWRWAYQGLIPDSHLDGLSVTDRTASWTLQLCQPQTAIFVAEDAMGQVVGFAAAGPARDATAGLGEVYAIYLLPTAAGAGLGARLMQRCTGHLVSRGHDRAILWVLETNHRARRFYEKLGWIADGGIQTLSREGFALQEVRYQRDL